MWLIVIAIGCEMLLSIMDNYILYFLLSVAAVHLREVSIKYPIKVRNSLCCYGDSDDGWCIRVHQWSTMV